jgi:DNA repair protein RadC
MTQPKFSTRARKRNANRIHRESQILARASQILDQRYFQRGEKLSEPFVVAEYLKLQLASQESEVFGVVFLDSQHRVLKFEQLFYGSINSCQIHPREIVKRALAHNAAAVILTHNHPSGFTEPSTNDHRLTESLKKALDLIDVVVLDHLIIGKGKALSFVERGWL